MRNIHWFLFVFVLTLAACQVTPDTQARIEDTLERVTTVLDRNADGVITNPEVKEAGDPNNPMTWVTVVSGVLAALGLIKAQSVQRQTDALYDVTHAPITKAV